MTLLTILKIVRERTKASHDAPWSSRSVAEIVEILDHAIEALNHGTAWEKNDLVLLFAPTGALQETSMDNGWADEFIVLSSEFDRLIQ